MISFLISHGADVTLLTRDGATAKQLALDGQRRRGEGTSYDECLRLCDAAEGREAAATEAAPVSASDSAAAPVTEPAAPDEGSAGEAPAEAEAEAPPPVPERLMATMLQLVSLAGVPLGRYELGEVHLWINSTADPRELEGDKEKKKPTGFRFDAARVLAPLAPDFALLFGDRPHVMRGDVDGRSFVLRLFTEHEFAWQADAINMVHFDAEPATWFARKVQYIASTAAASSSSWALYVR